MPNKAVRISLANKCQLLFGAAVVLILTAALTVVWIRMQILVREGQQETARKLANSWLNGKIELGAAIRSIDEPLTPESSSNQSLTLTLIRKDEFDLVSSRDAFLAEAIERFQTRSDRNELFLPADDSHRQPYYRFARAIRKSDLLRIRNGAPAGFTPTIETSAISDPLEMVLLLQLRADMAQRQLLLNRIYIVAAGLVAGLLAVGVFWFITMRLILSPVRVLRDTAQKIAAGDLNIRSDINTGDEFEQLSGTFNAMVENLKASQDQLHSVNKSLDLRLVELSKSNVALHETNKIKNDFLANVSHELRTPLNAIIGFAEVLEETLRERTGPVDEKRKRYVSNIITSSRRLLDLINDLLDLAKIDAGRMDLHLGPMSLSDTIEGMANLMRPQAEKHCIQLQIAVEPNTPLVQTDAGKFQQILFNFLSNAIKFTPEGGAVTISAGLAAPPAAPAAPAGTVSATPEVSPRIQVSVADTGPGIPAEMHEKIFEKFTQLDTAVTREHGGSGLGLAISKELARLLQGRIEVHSDTGKGATFTLIIPVTLEARGTPLMPEASAAPSASAQVVGR